MFEYCLICCLNIFARKTKASYAKQTCQMYCSMTINNLETNYSCMRPWVRQNKCIPTGHINMFCLICSSWAKHTKTPRGYKIGCLFTNRNMGTVFVFGKLVLNAKFRSLYSQWVGVLETKQQRDDKFTQTFTTTFSKLSHFWNVQTVLFCFSVETGIWTLQTTCTLACYNLKEAKLVY